MAVAIILARRFGRTSDSVGGTGRAGPGRAAEGWRCSTALYQASSRVPIDIHRPAWLLLSAANARLRPSVRPVDPTTIRWNRPRGIYVRRARRAVYARPASAVIRTGIFPDERRGRPPPRPYTQIGRDYYDSAVHSRSSERRRCRTWSATRGAQRTRRDINR